jgi:hypothetical protein
MRRRLAHAKSDFEDRGRLASERGRPVQRLGLVGNDIGRSQFVHRPLLSGRGAPGTPDERADSARMRDFVARVGVPWEASAAFQTRFRHRRPAADRCSCLGEAWQQKAAGRIADHRFDRVPEAACVVRGSGRWEHHRVPNSLIDNEFSALGEPRWT